MAEVTGGEPGSAGQADEHADAGPEAATPRDARDVLRHTARQYRELVEYSLGLICTHDLTGTILSINPAAAHSLGYEPAEGIGRNLREFLSAETRPLFDDYLRRIQEHGRDTGLMRVESRSGLTRVWMYRNVLSRSVDGVPYVLGHAIDITERVVAERALREREQELRAAHAQLEARVRERTIELEVANNRLRIEIAERQEAERSTVRAFAEQRDTLAFLSTFSESLAPLVTLEDLVGVVRGLPVPFLADWTMMHFINEDGTIRCVPGDHVDAEGQALLDTLAADVPSGSWSGSLVAAVFATGQPEIYSDSDSSEALASKLTGPAGPVEAIKRLGAGTAALLPLSIDGRVSAVLTLVCRDPHRFASSRALVVEDVARRLRLALERIQLYREAQQANRLKDEFLSTLSHELRTPLNAIFGWSRILQKTALDANVAHAVDVIERNAEAQLRLIEEVLDVSRIITGKMTLVMEPLDIDSILRATIDTVRPALQAKRIRLDERLAPDLPAVVGDPHRLQQVFWNLLSNALKFTPVEGTITLTLRGTPSHAEFEIADTGVGIRRDVLPFVFDRFRQADSSMTRSHGGLGLGLAIVRHIVELHGGSVRAASAGEGHGATFTIQLPVAAGQLTSGLLPEDGVAAAVASRVKLANTTVLVVEDDEDARDLITRVLRDAGARVIAASTTPEAVALARHVKPDVVVADLGLPGEDGFALLARMRAIDPALPAIALTAYARAADRERTLAAGFDEHVAKPVDPQRLVQIIAAASSSLSDGRSNGR